jgi:hypothetical protein
VFLRHDRDLFADIGRLLFDILTSFFSPAAGRTLRCAMVVSHQTFGEFGVWHPHWHSIVLEGGFDRHEIPTSPASSSAGTTQASPSTVGPASRTSPRARPCANTS